MKAKEYYWNWRKENHITLDGYNLNHEQAIRLLNDFLFSKYKCNPYLLKGDELKRTEQARKIN